MTLVIVLSIAVHIGIYLWQRKNPAKSDRYVVVTGDSCGNGSWRAVQTIRSGGSVTIISRNAGNWGKFDFGYVYLLNTVQLIEQRMVAMHAVHRYTQCMDINLDMYNIWRQRGILQKPLRRKLKVIEHPITWKSDRALSTRQPISMQWQKHCANWKRPLTVFARWMISQVLH